MPVNTHDYYHLELLQHIETDQKVTNRMVAKKLGVSVKLAHDLLSRMVEKGLIHIQVIHSRRWDYFLTPKGIMEKARLTMEFFDFSMHFYQEARKRSAQVCRDLAERKITDIGFLGAGDLAEITYLGVLEWHLTLRSVFDNQNINKLFLNLPIKSLSEMENTNLHAIIVCLYDKNQPMSKQFLPPSIKPINRFQWIF